MTVKVRHYSQPALAEEPTFATISAGTAYQKVCGNPLTTYIKIDNKHAYDIELNRLITWHKDDVAVHTVHIFVNVYGSLRTDDGGSNR